MFDYIPSSTDSSIEVGTAVGQILFWAGAKWLHTETTEWLWDDTNKRVGIGEAAPQDTLEVNGTVMVKDKLKFTQDDGNEYIDSVNDGYIDIGATTQIRLNSAILANGKISLVQTDGNEYIDGSNDNYTDIGATTAVRVNAPIYLTQVDGAEYIDSLADNYVDIGAGTQIRLNSPTLVNGKISLTQVDGVEYIDSLADNYVDIGAGTQIRLNTAVLAIGRVSLTQVDGNEYIEGVNDNYVDIGATTQIRLNSATLVADKLSFTQVDNDEYIDSLNDGFMDYGAGTAHRFLADVKITADNRKLYFGASDDASISYNGTDLIINSSVDTYGELSYYKQADGNAANYLIDNLMVAHSTVTDSAWADICWSPELGIFCVVGGGAGYVETSPDGITWSDRVEAATNGWNSICWSPELNLFCAVASTGAVDQVMTSPDGITWTARQASEAASWFGVCWSPELGLFAAFNYDGTDRVMTSPDGTNWTGQTAASVTYWRAGAWSPKLGVFCAIAHSGATNSMTSPDGVTWTISNAFSVDPQAQDICWSPELELFCVVGQNGADRVQTSPDGVTWTGQTAAEANNWESVCWSSETGLFMAVASTGTNRIMTSPDGITWTAKAQTEDNTWQGVCWAPDLGIFCAVSMGGTNRVMLTQSRETYPITNKILALDKIQFTQTDGNEYIDSLNDGYLDVGATTAIRLLNDTKLTADDRYLYFGTGDDASISYDGTDLRINTRAVGTGDTVNEGAIGLKEIATPVALADYGKIYTKADNILYFQDGEGAENAVGGHPIVKSFSASTQGLGASPDVYVAGYYEAPAAATVLNEGNTTLLYGTVRKAQGAHAFLVASDIGTAAGGAGAVTITVSGISVTDAGVRNAADTEILVADITTLSTNDYVETIKKWLGQITYTIDPGATGHATYALTFNYGFAKYDDMLNRDFIIKGFEAVGFAGANDTDFDIILFKHSSTGWTYSVAAFEPGNTAICKLSDTYGTDDELYANGHFAYKKESLNTAITGSGTEGFVIKMTSTANNAVEYVNFHVHTVI